ncbi:hypothetical protein [Pseudooceanicola sp. LIPI14-2-Ac024]|uniref:hypothetical protein n=1 Tax=Pseudooceanicola sp. LIPI14-2-Ac024 TaxID=3344875 RepID=UPI0035CED23A
MIWIPIFVWFLALIINVSMVLFEKNQAYRVVQNANRIVSTGYMQTEEEVEDYIRERIAHIAPSATINTTIADGTVTSVVAYRVTELLLPQKMTDLANIWINISSEHFMEY